MPFARGKGAQFGGEPVAASSLHARAWSPRLGIVKDWVANMKKDGEQIQHLYSALQEARGSRCHDILVSECARHHPGCPKSQERLAEASLRVCRPRWCRSPASRVLAGSGSELKAYRWRGRWRIGHILRCSRWQKEPETAPKALGDDGKLAGQRPRAETQDTGGRLLGSRLGVCYR